MVVLYELRHKATGRTNDAMIAVLQYATQRRNAGLQVASLGHLPVPSAKVVKSGKGKLAFSTSSPPSPLCRVIRVIRVIRGFSNLLLRERLRYIDDALWSRARRANTNLLI
jgi:hypothetical protein